MSRASAGAAGIANANVPKEARPSQTLTWGGTQSQAGKLLSSCKILLVVAFFWERKRGKEGREQEREQRRRMSRS